jgi:ArsR family metal-binding transcriptional regulator
MGINRESDIEASLQIGPTSEGRVRIYVTGEGFEIPMDFEPDEAEEIADELRAAAQRAAAAQAPVSRAKGKGKAKG